MRRITIIAISLIMLLLSPRLAGTASAEFLGTGFIDINGHWAEQTIVKLVNQGILDGYPDGTFRPDEPVTADQFLKILLLSFTQKHPNGDRSWTNAFIQSLSPANQSVLNQDYRNYTFKPSTVGYWAKPYIDIASDLNLISKTQFPDFKAKLTREKVAEIVYYTMKETEYLEDETYGKQLTNNIGDFQSATGREQKFISEVFAKGIMEGYPNGYFGVGIAVSRAEALAIVERIGDKSKRLSILNGPTVKFGTVVPTRDGSYKKIIFPNETMLKAYQVMIEAGKLRGTNYDLEETTLRFYKDAESKANALSKNPGSDDLLDEASLWLEPAYNTYGITLSTQEGAYARNQEAIRSFARYLFGYETAVFEETLDRIYVKVSQKQQVENVALTVAMYTVEVTVAGDGQSVIFSIVSKK